MPGGPATKREREFETGVNPKRYVGPDTRNRIARRAYELFEERGGEPGRDLEDWLRAEQQILSAQTETDLE